MHILIHVASSGHRELLIFLFSVSSHSSHNKNITTASTSLYTASLPTEKHRARIGNKGAHSPKTDVQRQKWDDMPLYVLPLLVLSAVPATLPLCRPNDVPMI